MPVGTRVPATTTALVAVESGSAIPGPLPPRQLLRRGGSVGPWPTPFETREPSAILADDAGRIVLLLSGEGVIPSRWRTRHFQRQVDAVRCHLDPIDDPWVLAGSFGREAFHGRRLGPAPAAAISPVRVAYAIRWIELRLDLLLPAWRAWFDPVQPLLAVGARA